MQFSSRINHVDCTKPHLLAQPELSGTGRAESSSYGGVRRYPLEHLDAPLDRAHRGAVLGCQVTETSFALPVSLCDGVSSLQGQVRKGRTPDRFTLRPGVPEASASIRRAAYWMSCGPRSRSSFLVLSSDLFFGAPEILDLLEGVMPNSIRNSRICFKALLAIER